MKLAGFYLIALLSVCQLNSHAQDLKIPDPSSGQRIEQDFGLGTISISYNRPNVKGRKILGSIEPYGIVWRTGANGATKIRLTDSVKIEGHWLAPGRYAFFTIPGATEYTVIFNNVPDQWGAYAYDSTKDALRFKIKPVKLDKKLETLTYQFANVITDQQCDFQVAWENTLLSMHLETDVDARVMANIAQAMQGDNKPYYKAAIYYYNHSKDMKQALAWIEEVEKKQPDAYNVKYWKAKIQLKGGDKQGAIKTANEGLKQAQAEPNVEYIRMNTEVIEAAGK
ncbi:MAG: DUF2911 domain-containing protein [Chitinophagaceae bacterium]